jgi:hypothetical protein
MKFWSGIMQGFKFAWKFKCTSQYHFIPNVLYGFNMWYMFLKKQEFQKKLQKLEPTNSYKLLNDYILILFSKVHISIIFLL